jgi:SAM-dependent methyltransferase
MTQIRVTVKDPLPIDEARELERAKYVELERTRPSYGATNHGDKATDLVMSFKPRSVVDFGCGRNQFAEGLRRRDVDAIGVDFVYPEAEVLAPMHRTWLASSSADVVTSFDALEHLVTADVPRVLREMRRVARPGGFFVFSISTRPSRITVKGENLHPTVRPAHWWHARIGEVGVIEQHRAHGRYVQGRFTGGV